MAPKRALRLCTAGLKPIFPNILSDDPFSSHCMHLNLSSAFIGNHQFLSVRARFKVQRSRAALLELEETHTVTDPETTVHTHGDTSAVPAIHRTNCRRGRAAGNRMQACSRRAARGSGDPATPFRLGQSLRTNIITVVITCWCAGAAFTRGSALSAALSAGATPQVRPTHSSVLPPCCRGVTATSRPHRSYKAGGEE